MISLAMPRLGTYRGPQDPVRGLAPQALELYASERGSEPQDSLDEIAGTISDQPRGMKWTPCTMGAISFMSRTVISIAFSFRNSFWTEPISSMRKSGTVIPDTWSFINFAISGDFRITIPHCTGTPKARAFFMNNSKAFGS
jgi:hypothetical protein